jgi:hypothetical protein
MYDDGTELREYNPGDFEDVPTLAEDLDAFQKARAKCLKSDDRSDRFSLWSVAETLYFTVKHSELYGWITRETAEELREYMDIGVLRKC